MQGFSRPQQLEVKSGELLGKSLPKFVFVGALIHSGISPRDIFRSANNDCCARLSL